MDTNTFAIGLVCMFLAGILLFVVGILASIRAKPPQEPQGFSIDPQLLRSGRHLKNSRYSESEFINHA